MDRALCILIRYSMVAEEPRRFSRNKGVFDVDGYKEELYDFARLDGRLRLFRLVTLPSLREVAERSRELGIECKVVIMISSSLPSEHQQKLRELIDGDAFIVIFSSADGASVQRAAQDALSAYFASNIILASCRMDDDDALSSLFVDQLNNYLVPQYQPALFSGRSAEG